MRYPPGARLVRRPEAHTCGRCGALCGRWYGDCVECTAAVERLWLPDWIALLRRENLDADSLDERLLAAVVVDEQARHSWTVTDVALTRLRCNECGSELATGPLDCLPCKVADENRWAWDHQAPWPAAMTPNEHALRVGRVVLRAPHRQKRAIVTGWGITLPFLLAGMAPDPDLGRGVKREVDAGRAAELEKCRTYGELRAAALR